MGIVSRSQGGGSGLATPLFNSTLGADAASIDTGAGGIAGSASMIQVLILARTDEAVALSSILVTVNNDGGANYDRVFINDTNAAVTGANALAQTSWALNAAGNTAAAGLFTYFRTTFPFYAGAANPKVGELTGGTMSQAAASATAQTYHLGYRSAAAISRLKVAPGGGTVLRAGSALVVLPVF